MRPGALEQRVKDQNETLETAARFVKPGGRLHYITCSVLKAENEDRVDAFLQAHDGFLPIDAAHVARSAGLPALAAQGSPLGAGLRLDPSRTGTDGFYVAAMTRAG
jgi:16S rRNA (cytosine967-C5)-methyltransferase